MTTLTLSRPALTARRLPRWAAAAAGAAAILAAVALRFLLGWTGWTTTVAAAAALYVIGLSAASALVEGRRQATDRIAATMIGALMVAATVPLVLILGYIVVKGAPALSAEFFTHSMNQVSPDDVGGGIYHALIGTIQQIALAALIAIPLGILTAIYLVEYGRGVFAKAVALFVDVMSGVPSIVAGLFVYTFLLLGTGLRPFGAAGSLALAILMLPVAVRAAEQMLLLVPRTLRESAYALGVPRWRTILKVVLPTAFSGLVTGMLLAVARVAGETAPLILLVGYSPRINADPFSGQQATLPMMIWDQLGKRTGNTGAPGGPWEARAWGAALVLVLLVLFLNIAARLIARFIQMLPSMRRRGASLGAGEPPTGEVGPWMATTSTDLDTEHGTPKG